MTPPPPPQLDIVSVAIAVATALLGANAGQLVGPYAVIVLGALGGAAWASTGRPESSRWAVLREMLWRVGLALLLTVGLAEGLHTWAGLERRWTLGPLAVLIAARPDWVIEQLRDLWHWRKAGAGQREQQ